MESKRRPPVPTDDCYILRLRQIFSSMDIVLGFTEGHLSRAQKAEDDDIDLDLYAIEANIATLYDILFDGWEISNMMH